LKEITKHYSLIAYKTNIAVNSTGILKIKNDDIEKIKELIEYLRSILKKPIYNGNVYLTFSDTAKRRGNTRGYDNDPSKRDIEVQSLMLYSGSYYIILHELTHALYQSNVFLDSMPPIVIEGIAMFVETKYKHQDMTNLEIANLIKKNLVNYPCTSSNKIDLDMPFELHNGCQSDQLYDLAAFIFLNQDEEDIQYKIYSMINYPPTHKLTFRDFAKKYQIDLKELDLLLLKIKLQSNGSPKKKVSTRKQ
jgi:hypothetical protein